ncbi:MAG: hypothetical protein HC774_07205 [Sphingomonadales bacterium]|nr:hypothetical protein [Sphingomonadales bacterium]
MSGHWLRISVASVVRAAGVVTRAKRPCAALIASTLATGYFPTLVPDRPSRSYWLMGLLASLLLFASILVHEMAHAVVARAAGLEIRSITLFLWISFRAFWAGCDYQRTLLRPFGLARVLGWAWFARRWPI